MRMKINYHLANLISLQFLISYHDIRITLNSLMTDSLFLLLEIECFINLSYAKHNIIIYNIILYNINQAFFKKYNTWTTELVIFKQVSVEADNEMDLFF